LTGSLGVQIVEPPVFFITVAQSRRLFFSCRKKNNATLDDPCYASGIGLREIARNMGIPAGTILSRAKREGWTLEIHNAKALVKREDASPAVTATEAVAITMQQRGERHVGHMANIVEKTLPHVEAMDPGAILDCN
jgi:hypothetical protein